MKLFEVKRKTVTDLGDLKEYYTHAGNLRLSGRSLMSLEGLPDVVQGSFWADHNEIVQLEGFSSKVYGDVELGNNRLGHLKDIHKCFTQIGGFMHLHANPIQSHILGLLLIPNLIHVKYKNRGDSDDGICRALSILNDYLTGTSVPQKTTVYDCHEKLIEAGLGKFAQV